MHMYDERKLRESFEFCTSLMCQQSGLPKKTPPQFLLKDWRYFWIDDSSKQPAHVLFCFVFVRFQDLQAASSIRSINPGNCI